MSVIGLRPQGQSNRAGFWSISCLDVLTVFDRPKFFFELL
jgi:hypothetical protein